MRDRRINWFFAFSNFYTQKIRMSKKEIKKGEEISITEELDKLIELKKNENSALKKIFESLQKPKEKNSNKF